MCTQTKQLDQNNDGQLDEEDLKIAGGNAMKVTNRILVCSLSFSLLMTTDLKHIDSNDTHLLCASWHTGALNRPAVVCRLRLGLLRGCENELSGSVHT